MQDTIKKSDQFDSSTELSVNFLYETLVTLVEKVDKLNNRLEQFSDLSKKITEIHQLHFPKFVQKEEDLRKKFLAEIILGIPKKRKKRNEVEKELYALSNKKHL